MSTMQRKHYDFLNAIHGDLYHAASKARLIYSERVLKIMGATVLRTRARYSRDIVMKCKEEGWVQFDSDHVLLTEKGCLAICDYKERFLGG